MKKVKVQLAVTEDERWWMHTLARSNGSTIIRMVMDLLEQKSIELDVPLPKERSIRVNTVDFYNREEKSGRAKFFEKIDKELGIK